MCHGRPCRSTDCPHARRRASRPGAACARTPRAAGSRSAPPGPPPSPAGCRRSCRRSRRGSSARRRGPCAARGRSAIASVMPQAPNGRPPAIDLPNVTRSGSRPHAAVSPPGPNDLGVGLVDGEQRARSRGSGARSSAWKPSSGSRRPMLLVIAGSVSTIATSRRSSARASAAGSLNGTRTVPSTVSCGHAALLDDDLAGLVELDQRLVEVAVVLAVEHAATFSRPVAPGRRGSPRCWRGSPSSCTATSAGRSAGASSSDTTIASSTGSRNWLPRAIRSLTARTTARARSRRTSTGRRC